MYAYERTDIETISASEIAIALPPKAARMAPYTIDAGPPLSKENWKVVATVSHAACIMISKLIDEERLMNRYFTVSL